MKNQHDYTQDLIEIRSMMERASKFNLLSGWAGITAGIIAIIGALTAFTWLDFNPNTIHYPIHSALTNLIFLAVITFGLAFFSAYFFSYQKAKQSNTSLWNATSRRLFLGILFPMAVGALVCSLFLYHDLVGLIAPFSLVFYGLSLFSASSLTLNEIRYLGLAEVILGLFNLWFIESGLQFWIAGFGIAHIIYGLYMNFRYNK